MNRCAFFILITLIMTGPLNADQPGLEASEFIFEQAPFVSCHASTIVETRSGLAASWFGGRKEGSSDVGIWLSRYDQKKWSAPVEVADGVIGINKRYPCWNPILFQPKDGPLLLFYKVGRSPSTWWGMLKTSSDEGRNWSDLHRLPMDVIGPVKNKPVQLPNGDILCGSSTEDTGWQVHFERTHDYGKTWETTAPVNDGHEIGAIQPSILFHKDNRLQAIGRTDKGKIFETWSDDNGKTWSKMNLTDLPNPNSGTDAVTLKDGRQFLVYNHTKKGRSPLNISISEDGKTWRAALVLENAPGEFSYPAVIQTRDGLVHITYTWNRERIKHVIVNPGKLNLRNLQVGEWPKTE
jgi:predicted neuraminidase